jgi:hypothetical protein
MSALSDRLTEDDARWLARMNRVIQARAAARLERERQEREAGEDAGAPDGGHDGAP